MDEGRTRSERRVIYVLCPDVAAETAARETYAAHDWARIIRIPTTFYLESVMYSTILQRRIEEWKDADFVGCIAWTAHKKLQTLDLGPLLRPDLDLVAFMYRGDPLVATATRWHPRFQFIWTQVLRHMGYADDAILNPLIPSFYCNYWAARPWVMRAYLDFFAKFKHALETLPHIQDALWSDSEYSDRGTDIASISSERCMTIWGVEYYPYHPFLCERLICFFITTVEPRVRLGAIR